jgi:hypothetical protein
LRLERVVGCRQLVTGVIVVPLLAMQTVGLRVVCLCWLVAGKVVAPAGRVSLRHLSSAAAFSLCLLSLSNPRSSSSTRGSEAAACEKHMHVCSVAGADRGGACRETSRSGGSPIDRALCSGRSVQCMFSVVCGSQIDHVSPVCRTLS